MGGMGGTDARIKAIDASRAPIGPDLTFCFATFDAEKCGIDE